MKIQEKIKRCPLWVVAVLIFFVAYKIDAWYVGQAFARWAESDGADAEAYAVFNHHSDVPWIVCSCVLVGLVWIVRKIWN